MLFPESERVSYQRNPLEQVICQLRFPAILRIAASPPVNFQEAVRQRFPVLKERKEFTVELPSELRKILPSELIGSASEVAYDFLSEDEKWTVALTKGFVALTTRQYERWEDFRQLLLEAWAAVVAEYNPPFVERVGLRYRNVIDRKSLGLDTVPWHDLLEKHILGVLQEPNVVDKVKSSAQEILLSNGPDEQVRIRHGLTRQRNTDEVCYLIDADFFTEEKVNCERARDTLDRFNLDAGRLFRWCIKPRLHDALGPRILD